MSRHAATLRHAGRAIALFIVLGAGVRWVAMEATFPPELVGDERYYAHVASNIAAGIGHQSSPTEKAFRPPGASFLYSLFIDPTAPPHVYGKEVLLRPLMQLQVVIGSLLVAATGLLAWVLFGPVTAALATAVAAVHPTLIAYSHYLWSENLFALLLTFAFAATVWGQRRASTAMAVVSGLALGAASLTRETAIGVAGVAALWWTWASWSQDRRRAVTQGLVLLAVAAAVVLPWTYRNYQLFQRFVPVGTVSWYSAGAGNVLDEPRWYAPPLKERAEYKREYAARETEMEKYDFARQRTLQEIRDEQPAWFFKKTLRNLPLLFNPDSFLFYKLRLGAYGEPSTPWILGLAVFSVLTTTTILLASVIGIAGAPRSAGPSLAVCILGLVAAGHIFAIANTRHRMPFEPLLIVYACYGALAWRQARTKLRGRRLAAAVGAVVFFAFACVPYFVTYSHTAAMWRAGTAPDAR